MRTTAAQHLNCGPQGISKDLCTLLSCSPKYITIKVKHIDKISIHTMHTVDMQQFMNLKKKKNDARMGLAWQMNERQIQNLLIQQTLDVATKPLSWRGTVGPNCCGCWRV